MDRFANHSRALRLVAWSLVLSIPGPASLGAAPPPDDVWREIDPQVAAALSSSTDRLIVPQRYRTVTLDWNRLDRILGRAPLELSPEALQVEVVLTLPLPDGRLGRFRIEESPIMEAALAAKLPQVKTYRAVGLDDPSAVARLDTTPAGFHGMILSDSGTVFIDPYARGETGIYVVYDTRDFLLPADELPVCRVGSEEGESRTRPTTLERPARRAPQAPAVATNGATFKQIDLAVAATGEYTIFHSQPNPANVAAAQAAITTTINRVNVVYGHDLAIRMNLVDNSSIVYTNPGMDPYDNECTTTELNTNQTSLDSLIGAVNYDLGHLMGGPGGGGGLAGQGPCLRYANPAFNSHARGCTGTNNPVGDPFDIDFVAHEIGHQWGAPHTFNGTVSNCGFGNREPSAAYEPGSGSTIMAYAGICGSDNLQTNSDDYFHGSSLETIVGYDPTAFGAAQCIGMTASGNTPPTAGAGVDRNIPKNTPFTLCGTGTDPDAGDVPTFLWEEFDLGANPGGPPNDPTQAPFFRSFDPTSSNCRTFPKLSDILNNTQTNGEILPNVAWAMTFRLTVFDNHPGAVGGGFDQDEVNVTVSGTSGPFQITAPNTAVSWTGGTMETVTWDVASTTSAPISCANVDIHFSTDGGNTFPKTVLAVTPNDGSEAITVPNSPTTTARLRVSCSDNVFFDINNANFTVVTSSCMADGFEPDGSSAEATTLVGSAPQTHNICPVGDEDWTTFTANQESGVVLETSGPAGDTRMVLRNAALAQIDVDDDGGTGLFSKIDRLCGVDGLAAGTYFVQVDEFGDNAEINSYDLAYTIVPCGCPNSLLLSQQDVVGSETFKALDSITTGPAFTVKSGGIAVLRVGDQPGDSVVFVNGTGVESGGDLSVEMAASPCS